MSDTSAQDNIRVKKAGGGHIVRVGAGRDKYSFFVLVLLAP